MPLSDLFQVWDCYGRLLYQSAKADSSITALAWCPSGEVFAVGSFNSLILCDKIGVKYHFQNILWNQLSPEIDHMTVSWMLSRGLWQLDTSKGHGSQVTWLVALVSVKLRTINYASGNRSSCRACRCMVESLLDWNWQWLWPFREVPCVQWLYAKEKPNTGMLLSVAWSLDGTQLAGGGSNGSVILGQLVDRFY